MIKKTVILSKKSDEVIFYINAKGINCFSEYDNRSVNKNICDHADISFFFDGEDTLFVSKENEHCADYLSQYCKKVIVLSDILGSEYPCDVKLNCVRAGDYFICNCHAVSPVILEHMKRKGINIVDVKQGYTKCSVLPVSKNAIITDDISVYNCSDSAGLDVLYVEKGDVALAGYNYGFIGGCGGKIDAETMIFCGNIKNHRDHKKILDFLCKYNVKYFCSDNKLTDIGSILPLYEV